MCLVRHILLQLDRIAWICEPYEITHKMRCVLALSTLAAVLMTILFFGAAHGIQCYAGERDSHKLWECGAEVVDCVVTIKHLMAESE